jgi:hypothetical protein
MAGVPMKRNSRKSCKLDLSGTRARCGLSGRPIGETGGKHFSAELRSVFCQAGLASWVF